MNNLTLLLRSHSFSFVLNRNKSRFSTKLSSFKFGGKSIFYRPGSSDIRNIRRLLFCDKNDDEYPLPPELTPSMILDIGANTDISTILLANKYPEAQIMCFEPIPDNFQILQKNIEPYSCVQAFPIALGSMDGTIAFQTPKDEKDFVDSNRLPPVSKHRRRVSSREGRSAMTGINLSPSFPVPLPQSVTVISVKIDQINERPAWMKPSPARLLKLTDDFPQFPIHGTILKTRGVWTVTTKSS